MRNSIAQVPTDNPKRHMMRSSLFSTNDGGGGWPLVETILASARWTAATQCWVIWRHATSTCAVVHHRTLGHPRPTLHSTRANT